MSGAGHVTDLQVGLWGEGLLLKRPAEVKQRIHCACVPRKEDVAVAEQT